MRIPNPLFACTQPDEHTSAPRRDSAITATAGLYQETETMSDTSDSKIRISPPNCRRYARIVRRPQAGRHNCGIVKDRLTPRRRQMQTHPLDRPQDDEQEASVSLDERDSNATTISIRLKTPRIGQTARRCIFKYRRLWNGDEKCLPTKQKFDAHPHSRKRRPDPCKRRRQRWQRKPHARWTTRRLGNDDQRTQPTTQDRAAQTTSPVAEAVAADLSLSASMTQQRELKDIHRTPLRTKPIRSWKLHRRHSQAHTTTQDSQHVFLWPHEFSTPTVCVLSAEDGKRNNLNNHRS